MSTTSENFKKFADCLPGEDRSFGGNQFYVDSLPADAWFKNLRSMTTPSQWKTISNYTRNRVGNKCEICGSVLNLEAHERWLFDIGTKTQKLIRLVCLCKLCHLGTHWGLTGNLGLTDMVKAHILSITGWSKEMFSAHLNERKAQAPSAHVTWALDVSMIESVVPKLQDPELVVARKHKELAKSRSKTTIKDDGITLDLSREVREGFVASIAETDAQMMLGVLLSTSGRYIAMHPSKVVDGVVYIPLSSFIEAHNNPVVMRDEDDIDRALEDRTVPKRLVADFVWFGHELMVEYLKDAILFSDA